jgi:hypothetical protein
MRGKERLGGKWDLCFFEFCLCIRRDLKIQLVFGMEHDTVFKVSRNSNGELCLMVIKLQRCFGQTPGN